MKTNDRHPGLVALLGSGETSAAGGQVFETIIRSLPNPACVSVLETPAGFELNSEKVAGRILDYLKIRLQNYQPRLEMIHARSLASDFSPDSPSICLPLLTSDLIYFGAGSPTYTVRQLRNSLALEYILARHRLGAAIVLASAATISLGRYALPVYEIYKVGDDLHWNPGLDFLSPYGLMLVFIPHWNNTEGGIELDTSRCYIGRARFDRLREMLPDGVTIVGIDEHTGLIIDFQTRQCRVLGKGEIHVLSGSLEDNFHDGQAFPISLLGAYRDLEDAASGIAPQNWQLALDMESFKCQPAVPGEPSPEVLELVERRQLARQQKNWVESDRVRDEIAHMGWKVQDTPTGQVLTEL